MTAPTPPAAAVDSVEATIKSLDYQLNAAGQRHAAAVAELVDEQGRPIYAADRDATQRARAMESLDADLTAISTLAATTLQSLQRARDAAADPVALLTTDQLARLVNLRAALGADATTVDASTLAARARAARDSGDPAARLAYIEILDQRLAAAQRKGDGSTYGSELDQVHRDLRAGSLAGRIEAAHSRFVDLSLRVSATRRLADGSQEQARRDFAAAVQSW